MNHNRSMNFSRYILFFIALVWLQQIGSAQIVINEFMASNDTTISDNFGEFDDWLELVNISADSINLFGWFLSDNDSNPYKHQFLDSIWIVPDSFHIIWVDDDVEQGVDHLNFKLGSDGEEIVLTNPFSELVDSVYFGQQETDISYGRYPNFTGDWSIMSISTPGSLNFPHDSSEYSPVALVSPSSGFFDNSIFVTLGVGQDEMDIYYSLDGSIPNTSSSQYSEPILITSTTVLRAITIKPGLLQSDVQTHHFILNTNFQLPTMALAIDPDDFPIGNGEYNLHVKYFDRQGALGFETDAGIERHGTIAAQNPYRISFKSEYGLSYIDYPLFENREYHKFKRLILRNASNDRFPNNSNSNRAHLRDGIIHTVYQSLQPNGAYSSFKPVHVYINHTYWGIYHLRERQDKYYVEELFGYDDVDLLERAFNFEDNRNAVEGDWIAYDELEDFVENQDMTLVENFEYLQNNIHYDEFIDYWILEVFVGNVDWLTNNIKYFRPRSGQDKWRWILWDVDHGLGMDYVYNDVDYSSPETDYLDWSTGFTGPRVESGRSNRIIRAILRNDIGRIDFINRFADLLNTTFLNENLLGIVDSLEGILLPDMHLQAERWNGDMSDWNTGIENVRNFITERPSHVVNHIKNKFDLDSTFQVTIEISPMYTAAIEINSILVTNFPWTGTYFSNVPITITANPFPGYDILNWEGSYTTSNTIVLDSLYRDTTFTLIITPISNHSLVINEFLAKNDDSCFDDYGEADDFIELYNGTDTTVALNGMIITDDPIELSNGFTIIDTSLLLLLPGDYMVFWADEDVEQGFNHLNFKLDGDGDQIYLFNEQGNSVLDSVTFDNQEVDISYGRYLDGSYVWTEMQPTPGMENVGLVPMFSISSDSVNFPITYPYDTVKAGIELINDGLSDLVISNSFIEDQSVQLISQIPLIIEPGVSDSLLFTHTPLNTGHMNTYAYLQTNDPTQPNVEISFYGTSELRSHPILYEIKDVPEDRGLKVKIEFIQSKFDGVDTSDSIDKYVIWRFNTNSSIWDSVSFILANGDFINSTNVFTLCDSTIDSSCLTSYKISARLLNSDSIVWSNTLAGYSLDNLPPSTPTGLTAIEFEDILKLTWDSNSDDDLVNYILDKSDDSLFYIDQFSSFNINDTVFYDINYHPDSIGFYRLSAIDNSNNQSSYSTVYVYPHPILANDENYLTSSKFILHQNYPNPFNPITSLRYDLPEDGLVNITIYDMMGRVVKTLVNGSQSAGNKSVQWKATNNRNEPVSAGLYFYMIQAGGFRQTKKMVLLK